MLRKILLLLFLLIINSVGLYAPPAHADDDAVPILSMTRVSLGASGDYCGFQSAGDQPLPAYTKSWEFGLVGAYTLVSPKPGTAGPTLSLAAASSYDVDNKWFRHRIGLRVILFRGGSY